MMDRPLLVALAPHTECEVLFSSKLEDEFHLVNAETLQELLRIADDKKPISMILVYTPLLVEDCAELRSSDALVGIPIVAIAKFGSEQLQDGSIHAGAIDYIDVGNLTSTVLEARIRSLYELKRNRDQLTEVARLDALTGIPNRNSFDETISLEWRRCCRDFNVLSVIMVDIDAFSSFNDHYGAGVGDNCLKRITSAIENNCLRAADIVARYDNDEFVALLPCTEFENALRVAENICRAVSSLNLIHEYSDCADVVTVSVGIATIDPTQDQGYKALIHEVKEVLHMAQHKGGNQAQGVEL